VIRAFIEQREKLAANAAILKRLAEIDKMLLEHDTALRDIYQKLLPLLAPPPASPRQQIGFHTPPSLALGPAVASVMLAEEAMMYQEYAVTTCYRIQQPAIWSQAVISSAGAVQKGPKCGGTDLRLCRFRFLRPKATGHQILGAF
jgi:hypothetical protein